MKTFINKFLCLLLMTICCTQVYAARRYYVYPSNAHILRVGLSGGGIYNLTPTDCTMKSEVGAAGAIALDYVFYKPLRSIDLGLKTGLDLGYQRSPYKAAFSHQFSQQDYLGNQMDYTTSGEVKIAQHQLLATIPLMFALRSNGFVCNFGVRLQTAVYQTGKQHLSNPTVTAYYPAYNVAVTNELITGIVEDSHLSTPLDCPSISLECHAAMEIGYEHEIRNTNSAIGVLAYVNMGFLNLLKATGAPIIQVAPITDMNNPAPTVTINNAYNALLTSYIPMQFGIKVYYAFHLTK